MLKKYFITGLLVWIPLAITAWLFHLVIGTMDQTLLLLPARWRPDAMVGFHIPGSGVILTVVVIFVTGILITNYVGNFLLRVWEGMLKRIPLVNTVYYSVKQVSDTLFSSSGNAFRQAVLVEYPRAGMWTIGFLTGVPGGEMKTHLPDESVSLYVPTTPMETMYFSAFSTLMSSSTTSLRRTIRKNPDVGLGVVAPPEQAEQAKLG
jgi:uncharacterized membrane protein